MKINKFKLKKTIWWIVLAKVKTNLKKLADRK